MNQLMSKGMLKHFIFANTIYCSNEYLTPLPNVTVVPSHEMAADVIHRLKHGFIVRLPLELYELYIFYFKKIKG